MANLLNNYIIGLGSTGGNSVAAFKCALELRNYEAKKLKEKNVRFRYLYIDSNEDDIRAASKKANSGKWAILGKPVNLEAGDCLFIKDTNLTENQARMQANIAPWYGDTHGVNVYIPDINIQGANQRRRYGRMLLARRAGELKSRLTVGGSELTRDSERPNSVTYHIFATLGGGTGSGSIIDLVAYLYATAVKADKDNPPEIYLYLYVGGGDPAVQTAAVNGNLLYMNEYSALRDLNALMAGRYKPDLALSTNGDESYHSSDSPIKSVFISSEASDRKLSLSDQIDNMANACLDLISLVNSDGINSDLTKPFTGEDLIGTAPGEISSDAKWDTSQQRELKQGELCERSYRFQTISVSRCKEPVREIETILKCALAEQVIIRLLKGDDEPKYCTYENNTDIYQLDEPPIEGSDLYSHHQNYENNILGKFEEKYKPEAIDFEPDTLKQLTRDAIKQVQAIQEDAILDSQESSGEGTDMQKRCKAEAAKLKARIEEKLKDRRDWSKSPARGKKVIWGIEDIITYLTDLTTKLSEEINNKFTFSQTYGNLEKRHLEWGKIVGLTHLFRKQEEMYELHLHEAQAIVRRAIMERKAMIRRLVWKALKSELLNLIGKMKNVRDNLLQQKAKQEELEMTTEKAINEFNDSKNISYLYDEKMLAKHRSYYKSKDSHSTLAQYMIELDRGLHTEGERHLNQYIPDVDSLDAENDKLSFWNKSKDIHQMLCNDSRKYKSAYHSNIYEALSELKTTDTEKYHKILESLELKLAPSARLDPTPMGGSGLTMNYIPSPYKAIEFGKPAHDIKTDTNIAKEIETNVLNKVSHMASDPQRCATFDLNDKHELRILYTIYWMPVRFFSFMNHLHNQYHLKSIDNPSRRTTNLYYSNIDDKDDQKPDLVPRNVSPKAHECRLYYTIGAQLLVSVSPESQYKYMLVYEKEVANGVKYHVHSLKGKVLRELPHYEEYTADQMAEGDEDLYQHIKDAVHAWFALETADPKAVLAAMKEKYVALCEALREKPGATSHECELQYAAYNEFEKLTSHLFTR